MKIAAIPPASATPAPSAELKAAAQKFEAVFLRQMIGSMRQGALAEDILGSSATASFREMADANTADAMSKMGAFGIAQMIERQMGSIK